MGTGTTRKEERNQLRHGAGGVTIAFLDPGTASHLPLGNSEEKGAPDDLYARRPE